MKREKPEDSENQGLDENTGIHDRAEDMDDPLRDEWVGEYNGSWSRKRNNSCDCCDTKPHSTMRKRRFAMTEEGGWVILDRLNSLGASLGREMCDSLL